MFFFKEFIFVKSISFKNEKTFYRLPLSDTTLEIKPDPFEVESSIKQEGLGDETDNDEDSNRKTKLEPLELDDLFTSDYLEI